MTAPSVYSIDAGLPFARDLAAGVMQLADNPQRLARALVLVPSQRAAQALQAAFLDHANGKAMLLPRMLPIGDFGDDDDTGSHGFDDIGDLPPQISGLRRQICLAKLLRFFPLGGQHPSQPQAMLLASSLAQLLDQLYNADATADQLRDLLPEQFSAHWQDILTLLGILIERWPDILSHETVMDSVDRRNRLLRRRAVLWQETPPDHLVVIAGSTGSISATRDLIATIAGLPDGHVVLPGLDRDVADQWAEISTDSGHPQYQLAQLLAHMEMTPDQVRDWVFVSPDVPPALAARRALMREVFRPAALSASWQRLGDEGPLIDRTALGGLKIITARSRREEAGLIALMLREVLETPGRTAALVTPDRQLGELVIADLARWNIIVEDTAGQRLSLTAAGRFLTLLCDAIAVNFAPLELLSLLKHPFAAGGMSQQDFRAKVDAIEIAVLRGSRPGKGLEGLLSALDDADLRVFLDRHIWQNLAPAITAWQAPNPAMASLAVGLGDAAELLCATEMKATGTGANRDSGVVRIWAGPDGKAAGDLLSGLALDGTDSAVNAADMPLILHQLLDTITVYPHVTAHPRLAILGAVEARMHPAQIVGSHRIVLGGFNEGNWPPRPDMDPWMNAAMRASVGLPPRNWRSGLSAHDFFMAICSPDVVITRAEKETGTPTTKSRWLQRMEVVTNALGLADSIDTGAREHAWLHQLEPREAVHPVQRPAPCPPVSVRPRKFSATEIDLWVTDPYAIYAKKILRLRPLDPIDRPADAALRGIMFHDALADFIKAHPHADMGSDALAELLKFGKARFANAIEHPSIKFFWWSRFETMAAWFVEAEARRRTALLSVHGEVKGSVELASIGGPVTLTARADRLEYGSDKSWVIVDYKTGIVPSQRHVNEGVRNQLAVEGLIAFEGGFEGLPAGVINSLEYWKLSGKKSAPGEIFSPFEAAFDGAEIRRRLEQLATHYDNPQTCYPSEPDPSLVPAFKPYQHLSRSREWQADEGPDE